MSSQMLLKATLLLLFGKFILKCTLLALATSHVFSKERELVY